MYNAAQNTLLVALWVSLSLVYLILLNRVWAPRRRRIHNDVIGWQIATLGTIYAVIIGFMLGSVWTNYQAAEANVESEANALVNLFRSADGLPDAQRSAIQASAERYAAVVLHQEWPAMSRLQVPTAGAPFIAEMSSVLAQTPAPTPIEQASLGQSMQELSNVSQHRQERILDSMSGMPGILWAVLITGGIITTAACCLIGADNVSLHFTLIFALSLLISLALVAIADIDRGFQGSVHIDRYSFLQAQETMERPVPAREKKPGVKDF